MNDLALNEWVCERCSLINKKCKTACIACGNSKKSWFCVQCNLRNSSDNNHCTVCFAFSPARSPALANLSVNIGRMRPPNRTPLAPRAPFNNLRLAENTAKSWMCENCLHVNSNLVSQCQHCPVNVKSPASSDPPKKNTSMVIQMNNSHRSQLLEDIRQREEEEAVKLWHEIVQCCRVVRNGFLR